MTVQIITGNALDVLRTLPDESVHCVVTSPPYWGLRDYGITGQLGLERTLGEHIAVMVEVFREMRRVLRSDGTLWMNYGDSYATSVNGRSAADTKATGNDDRTFRDKPFSTIGPIYDPDGGSKGGGARGENRGNANDVAQGRIVAGGYLKPKDLCGVPWRVAFALQADGWYLRQDIIWSKPNPMPESVRDRCTKAHEYLFLLSKSERYYFDQEAILEPCSPATNARLSQDVQAQIGSERAHAGAKTNGNMKAVARASWKGSAFDGPRDLAVRPDTGRKRAAAGSGIKNNDSMDAAPAIMPEKRNRRSVWTVNTEGYSEAHFATFPPALIEPCIKAGCPQGGTVLDPFGGAGTTALVADRLQCNAILIDINPDYVAMARDRIDGDAPLFLDRDPAWDAMWKPPFKEAAA